MSYVFVLLMSIDVVIVVVGLVLVQLFSWECLYPSFYIQWGKITNKITKSVTT
jgi:hypothetical protein